MTMFRAAMMIVAFCSHGASNGAGPVTPSAPASAGTPSTAPATTKATGEPTTAPGQTVPVTKVTYLATSVASHDQENVVIRGELQISGQPNRWYGVYFNLGSDANTSSRPVGQELQKLWNNLFMPDPGLARWSDVRLAFALRDIEGAFGLPKDGRTILWAHCGVWDYDAQKYVEGGREVRTPVIVTTDPAGRITKVETFNTRPPSLAATGLATIKARECQFTLNHLRPKPNARLYRVIWGRPWSRYDVFIMDSATAYLHHDSRGAFFEKIDTPDKARELALLPFGGCTIIKTKEQYQAVADALKAMGWKAPKDMIAAEPPAYGVAVTEVPGLGYRVAMLAFNCLEPLSKGLGAVVYREFPVGHDGRIGLEATICINSPQIPVNVPPDWKQPVPAGPEEYDKAVRSVLKGDAVETVPAYVTVTDKTATIPCREGDDPKSYMDLDRP